MSFQGFAAAKTVPAKAPKSKAPAREEVVLEGLEGVAALDTVIKSLKAILDSRMIEVKGRMVEHFARTSIAAKAAPVSFRGVEGDASASCELRRRASSSPLTEEEQELCALHGVKTETVVDTVETYIINPTYLSDPAVMTAVEAALKKAKGIPADLFMKQEEKSKVIVAETGLADLFAKKISLNDAEAMLGVIGVPAVKATMNSNAIGAAFKLAEKLALSNAK